MVNLLLNDDQTVPTSAKQRNGTPPIGLQMIAMEVARYNDHVYTLGNYCVFMERGKIMLLFATGNVRDASELVRTKYFKACMRR